MMNRNLLLVAGALVTWGIGEGMFLYFQPLYLQELGASPLLIGGILGGVGVAMTSAHLPAGFLADRLGRRPLLWAAWLTGTCATGVMAMAGSLPVFVAGMALYGMTSFVAGPLNSYVTAARGNWSVGRALTLLSATFNAGAILGPLLGGWIGSQVGLQRTFLVAAFFFILSSLIIAFIPSQPVERPAAPRRRGGLGDVLTPRYIQFLLVIFIAMFVMFLPQPLSQNFLQNERGMDLEQIGRLVAIRSAGIVVFNLVLGQLNARTGFLLAQAAMSLFTLLLWRGSGLPAFMLGYLLLGSYATARSLAAAQGRALVDNANMGLAYGIIETVFAMAIILAPPLAGWIYAQNPVWIYSISLALIGLAIVTTTLFSPLRAKDLETTQ